MPSKHETTQTCPICAETILHHVHCSNASCAFVVTTCPRCDREQAVNAFLADHEKDCLGEAVAIGLVTFSAFRSPRRAA